MLKHYKARESNQNASTVREQCNTVEGLETDQVHTGPPYIIKGAFQIHGKRTADSANNAKIPGHSLGDSGKLALHLTCVCPQIIKILHEKLETQKELEINKLIRTNALLKRGRPL